MSKGLQNLGFIGLFLIANMSFATPIVFEKNYTNHAWGYITSGCMIDESQNMYEYKLGVHGPEMPISFVKKVPANEFQDAVNLARAVANIAETLVPAHAAYDAGSMVWTTNVDYNGTTVLKQTGDWKGSLTSPEALQLIDLIDSWCQAL